MGHCSSSLVLSHLCQNLFYHLLNISPLKWITCKKKKKFLKGNLYNYHKSKMNITCHGERVATKLIFFLKKSMFFSLSLKITLVTAQWHVKAPWGSWSNHWSFEELELDAGTICSCSNSWGHLQTGCITWDVTSFVCLQSKSFSIQTFRTAQIFTGVSSGQRRGLCRGGPGPDQG